MRAVNKNIRKIAGCSSFNILRRQLLRIAAAALLLVTSTILNGQNVVYTSNGSFVVPSGIVSITVECWGAGGAGGGNPTARDGGGGGGGGAYSRSILTVVPGTTYQIFVGQGGTGSTGDGSNGGDTWFGSPAIVLAKGGSGGLAPVSSNGGSGGAGGDLNAGLGDIVYRGGNGGVGKTNANGEGGPGGSSAGTGANGSDGPASFTSVTAPAPPTGGGRGGNGGRKNRNGNPGASPGGGGGGAGEGNYSGGNGARGLVVISWASHLITSSGTFTVPGGVTSITVECWGAGGGGSSFSNSVTGKGGGGGGGAYASSIIPVSPGNVYNIVVGTGGGGSSNGGATSFDGGVIVAAGGRGGVNNSSTGGAGGSIASSTGTIKFRGGNGANGGAVFSGGGGGGAGNTGNGADAPDADLEEGEPGQATPLYGGRGGTGVSSNSGGNAGDIYGGGGSGALRTGSNAKTGGSGANGLVVVSWTPSMFYSKNSGDPRVLSNWETVDGYPPADFSTDFQTFKIRSGHVMTTSGIGWVVSGNSTYVIIEDGAVLTENTACSFSSSTTLQINGTGILNHNVAGTGIFTGGEFFSDASTVNYGLNNNQTIAAATYGNLILSVSGTKTFAAGVIVKGILSREGTTLTAGTAPSFGTAASLRYKGSAAQTSSIEFPATFSGTGGVIIDNASGVTLQASKTIVHSLTFVNGKINTGANNLYLSETAVVTGAGAGKYVNGNLGKAFSTSLTSRFFEIGDAARYTPVDLAFSGMTLSVMAIVKSTAGDHPNTGTSTFDPDLTVNRYWTVSTLGGITGFSSYDATLTFDPADIDPFVQYTSLYGALFSGGAWTYPVTGTRTATTIQITGIPTVGDLQAGAQSYYESNGSGPWNVNTTWRFFNGVWVTPSPTVPALSGGSVTIRNGHSVTVSAPLTIDQLSIQTGGSLILNSGLILNDGLGVDLSVSGTLSCTGGVVSGTGSFTLNAGGTLVIASPEGITLSGASGAIQTGTRSFSQSANYFYAGSSPQVTGDALPSGVNNIEINNASGVTLTSPLSLGGTMILTSGTFTSGANSLTFSGSDTPLARTSGTLNVSPDAILSFGTPAVTSGAAFTIPDGTFSSPPVISNLTIYRSNGVTLNNQMLSLGGRLLCYGPLNTNNNLTLLSDASGTAYIDGDGTAAVTGNVTMQRYLDSGFGYKYFSSPFVNATVGEFGDDMDLGSPFTPFYAYDENRLVGGVPASGWVSYKQAGNILYPLTGYAVNLGSDAAARTIDVTGPVNNGIVSITLYNHNHPYTKGFNLVGNPYPSPIDWDASDGWTKTNIDNALYFFKASSSDQYGGSYSTYINGISSDGLASGIISSMQGFFVHVKDGAYPVTGTLGMENDVRYNATATSFLKKSGPSESSGSKGSESLLRIGVSYADNPDMDDPMVVYSNPDATLNFEGNLDAFKFFNTALNSADLYSIANDGSRLSVNAIPEWQGNSFSIPLGIRVRKDSEMLFRLRDISGFDQGDIALFDAVSGESASLVSGMEYRVTLTAGTYNNRFFLKFADFTTGTSAPEARSGIFNIYQSRDKLHADIQCLDGNEGLLRVSTLTGQPVLSNRIFENGSYEFDLRVVNGIYIVSFVSGNSFVSRKIIIQNR